MHVCILVGEKGNSIAWWVGGWVGVENVLCSTHALPLFQVRARAEAFVEVAGENQHPRSCSQRCALLLLGFPPRQLILGLRFHGRYFVRELREELAGDGVAAAGVVETEDADVAEVGGGDVVGF